jgi:eukaryotic-like serine/threonine-protein kinase
VEGESLRERLGRAPRLTLSEALRIAREAAHGLHHAHVHGVVHRDVKPENILLTRDGSTLVADFGIARSSGAEPRITSAGIAVGTPMYMSPEQASGEGVVDPRGDVYSLGCVLYEMLAGMPPFQGTSAQTIAAKHISQPAPPLRGAPPDVAAVVARALAKLPEDRFATAAEFADALDRVAPSSGARSWPRVAIVAVAAALGVAAVALWQGREGRRETGTVASGFNRRMAPITVAEGVEEWPAWSPDGARLAYVAEVGGYRQLFVRTLGSGEDRRVTRGTRDDIQPAWSPDGRRLAFVRAAGDSGKLEPADLNDWYFEGGDVWTVDVSTGAERRLVRDAFGPAWSPDGRRLAFDAA